MNALQWLRENGFRVRGHTLVWPGWRNMPRDLEALAGDPSALRSRVLKHIEDELIATRGQLVEWDVLNEPYTNTDLQCVLGEQEMAVCFQEARRHEPDALLCINDYSILRNGGFDRAHQDHYFDTAVLRIAIRNVLRHSKCQSKGNGIQRPTYICLILRVRHKTQA